MIFDGLLNKIKIMLYFYFSNSTANRAFKPDFFKRVILGSFKYLELDKQKNMIDLAIIGKEEIRRLNQKYRGKNKPTDVLSFSFAENKLKLSKETPFLFWGNIVICLPVAKIAAEKQKISLEKELIRITIHGLLHLLGYDHEKSAREKQKMESLEKRLWRKAI